MGHLRSNVIAFDDGPFSRDHHGDVPLVGVVCARTRVDGVLLGKVRRDGANATRVMASLLGSSPFRRHVRAVLLQGIAVAGFNVVDVHALSAELDLPVVVVARRAPDLHAMKDALFARVPAPRASGGSSSAPGPWSPSVACGYSARGSRSLTRAISSRRRAFTVTSRRRSASRTSSQARSSRGAAAGGREPVRRLAGAPPRSALPGNDPSRAAEGRTSTAHPRSARRLTRRVMLLAYDLSSSWLVPSSRYGARLRRTW